mmetsp:Transcript_74077/g.187890  ORF Transcript_74077/g.187890 Transcript_74077/m.187890 type:complete len:368 (+) Transcript_74077:83-1186(+)
MLPLCGSHPQCFLYIRDCSNSPTHSKHVGTSNSSSEQVHAPHTSLLDVRQCAQGALRPLHHPLENAVLDAHHVLHGAVLSHRAFVEDNDAVKIQDRLDTVCDRDDRGHREVVQQRVLRGLLRVRVQRRGALVQQQHWWLPDHHASQAQELPLAEADVAAVLGDLGIDSAGQRADVREQLHGLQRLPNPAIRELVEGIDVVAPAAGEDRRVLGHQADDGPKAIQADLLGVEAADHDPAAPGLQDPKDAKQGRGLPAARLARKADLLARGDVDPDILEHALVVAVARRQVLQLDSHAGGILVVPQVQPDGGRGVAKLLGHALGVLREAVHGDDPVARVAVLAQLRAAREQVLQLRTFHGFEPETVGGDF